MSESEYADRHQSTQHMMKTLRPNPRLDGVALDVAQLIWHAAQDLCVLVHDGPELTAGLRKLREAKDCCVIQGLEDSGALLWQPNSNRARSSPGMLPWRASFCSFRASCS